jgi:hypothetical protein
MDGSEKKLIQERKRIGVRSLAKRRRIGRVAAGGLVLLAVLGSFGYFFVVRPAAALMGSVAETRDEAQSLYRRGKDQDLAGVQKGLPELREKLIGVKADLDRFAWLRFVPVLSSYWRDAGHAVEAGRYGVEAGEVMVESLAPYADLLGLKGGSSFSGGSAEARLQTAVSTLEKLTPALEGVGEKTVLMRRELEEIDPDRYPEKFRGEPIREKILALKKQVDDIQGLLAQTTPFVKVLPQILGGAGPKKYLVLFQNNAEIRPTGGFLTAYAIFTIDQGKIRAGRSEDIYILDNSVRKIFPLPEPIKLSPLAVSSWRLRDSNLSPDYVESVKQFKEMYRYAGRAEEVDGIIAIDTQVLVDTLHVLGPLYAAGIDFSDKTVPECDCPQVIYELEKIVDTPAAFARSGRKDILGVLMLAIMQKGLQSSPSHTWPTMLQTLLSDLKEKHVLLYFEDEGIQRAVEKVGFAGRIVPFEGDYLHVNDTNFGGAKSNLFIRETVTQDYQVQDDGSLVKTVTVDYVNPHPWSNCNLEAGELCLNGEAPIWVRVYTPAGSELVSSEGSSREVKAEEDLGKTVFSGWLEVRPEGTAAFSVSYKLPMKAEESLPLLIQKQPGKKEVVHEIRVNGALQQREEVRGDLETEVKF